MLKTYHFHLASLFFCLIFLSGCGQNSGSMQANAASSLNPDESITEATKDAGIVILKHPQSLNVTINSGFYLSVTTKSDLPLRYQWYKNNLAIPNAISPTYSVSKSMRQDQGLYHVVVSNGATNLSSHSASVNISPENSYLKITHQPLSKSIVSGQPLLLRVEVTGDGPLNFQWYKNGNAIPGATLDSYQIPVSRLSDSGHYQVQISNHFSAVESDFANITITDAMPPPAEISISVQPTSTSAMKNHPFTLSILAVSSETLKYQWYKNNQAIIGAVEAHYTQEQSSAYDEGIYYVLISNQQRSVKSREASVQINTETLPLSIIQSPQSKILRAGQAMHLEVDVVGEAPLVYQWYKDGSVISGANKATFDIPVVSVSDAGNYQVKISNGLTSVNSGLATVVITSDESTPEPVQEGSVIDPAPTVLSITQAPEGQTISEGDDLLLQVSASGNGPFTYQWQKNGSLLPTANQRTLLIKSTKKSDQGSYRVIISNASQSIYSDFVNVWITDKIQAISIKTHPESQLVPEGSVKQLSVSATGGGFITYQWRKNGEPIANAFSSTLTLTDLHEEDAGYYDVVVANSQGSSISNPAYLDILSTEPALVITQHPEPKMIRIGQAVSLSVNAQSATDLHYQWFKNGRPIAGATTSSYHIMQADIQDTGSYNVLISDANTSQHSLPAEVSLYESYSYAIELSWDTPRSREDGSPLRSEEILEYVIEYGYEDQLLNQRITIPHRLENRFILDDLYPGQLFLRIATVDIDGIQGHFSDVISLSID